MDGVENGLLVLVALICAIAIFAILLENLATWAGYILILVGLFIGVEGQVFSIWWWAPGWIFIIFGSGVILNNYKKEQ